MKKTVKLICLMLCICLMLALVACGSDGSKKGSSGGGGNDNGGEQHTHNYGAWAVTKESSCTENGQRERSCECGDIQTEVIAAGHKLITELSVTPSCDISGYDVVVCERCGQQGTINIDLASGHSYGESVVKREATCTDSGYTESVCTKCGSIKTEPLSAKGHAYMDVSTKNGAVCRCKDCGDVLQSPEDKEIAMTGSESFGCDLDFTFDVYASSAYEVFNNLKIVDFILYGTKYEDLDEAKIPYDVREKSPGVYTVYPTSAYDYATTYVAQLGGNLRFCSYSGNKITFSTKHNENHENVYEYSSKIVFLKALEESVGGYYPYTLEESGDYLHVTVAKADGIKKGDILCIGNVSTKEEILDPTLTDCVIGKVHEVIAVSATEYKVILSAPEMKEVFDALDISYEEAVNLSEENIDIEEIKAQLQDELTGNEEFVKLLATVNVASEKYLSARSLTSDALDNKSFLKYITYDIDVRIVDFTLIANIGAKVDIPVKDKYGVQLGSITANFSIGVEVGFDLSVDLELRYWAFVPTGVEVFDIRLKQTDKIDIKLEVAINIKKTAEKKDYVLYTKLNRLHRADCPHAERINPENKAYLTATQAQTLLDEEKAVACLHCQATKQLNFDILLINKRTMKIHARDCYYDGVIAEENRIYSEEEIAYWTVQGYTCCEYCTPDSVEKNAFEREFLYTLEYADWKEKLDDINAWLGTADGDSSRTKGAKIVDLTYRIFLVTVNLDIYYIMDFDLNASFCYEYEVERETVYGLRLNRETGRMESYKTPGVPNVTKDQFDFMGKLSFRIGLKADLYVSVVCLENWVRAGITAEAGFYVEVAGVLHLTPNEDENYAGAYLEAGIYLEINAYYKLFSLSDSVTVYENQWPLLALGYNKVFYAYEEPKEELYVDDAIDVSELLSVKGFDLKTMEQITSILELEGVDGLYAVRITFGDGTYFALVGDELVLRENAPCDATDTMTIVIETSNAWDDYDPDGMAICLKQYTIILYANNHNYSETFRDDATCIKDGKVIFVCNDCGKEYIEYQKGEHLFSDWSCDSDSHSRYCSRCNETEAGEHTFTDWESADSTSHRKECTSCGYGVTENHTMDGKKCALCDYRESSEGLTFTYNGTYDAYEVSGIGTCKDADVIIPEYYRGLPVYSVRISSSTTVKSIVLPKTVWNVSLSDCINLETLTVLGEIKNINSCSGCIRLVDVVDGVGYVANWVVSCEKGTTYASIRKGTVGICSSAFYGCTELSGVYIPSGVKIIGDSAFSGCKKLEAVNIPEGVLEIGDQAFNGCSSLSFVDLPDSIRRIGQKAFGGAPALQQLENVYYIDNWAVGNYSNLAYNGNVREGTVGIADWSFNGCGYFAADYGGRVIFPSSLKYIGEGAFYNCTKIESIDFGNGVEYIGESAFVNCTKIKSVILPNSLKYIGKEAFLSVSAVHLGPNMEDIAADAFPNVQSFTVDDSNPYLKAVDGVVYSKDGAVLVAYPRKKSNTSYTVLDGTRVINERAFYQNEALQSVFIPNSVEIIGKEAFCGCSSLSTVSTGTGLCKIGVSAFEGCRFSTIYLPSSVTYLGAAAFKNSYLSSITIPEGVETITQNLFYGCSELAQIVIPSSVKAIEKNAFASAGLVEIVIPGTVECVEDQAFFQCPLLSIYIEKGVDFMGTKVFYGGRSSTVIRCEDASAPSGWTKGWNVGGMDKYGKDKNYTVEWNATK